MRKLAVVRSNADATCPFGLSIPSSCKCAGDNIEKLAPISIAQSENESNQIKNANKKFLAWHLSNSAEEISKCKYADVIIDDSDSVVCNYGDTAPGLGQVPLFAPPFYNQMMANNVLGLQSYPITYYGDYNISRNMYYGIFSLQGSIEYSLKKIAKSMDGYGGTWALFHCPEDKTILLLHRPKTGKHSNKWDFPGGSIEDGETPQEGILRELSEELGFIPSISDILSWGFKPIDHSIVFVAAISKEAKDNWENLINLNAEHTEYRWFNFEEIPEDLHPVTEMMLANPGNNPE